MINRISVTYKNENIFIQNSIKFARKILNFIKEYKTYHHKKTIFYYLFWIYLLLQESAFVRIWRKFSHDVK